MHVGGWLESCRPAPGSELAAGAWAGLIGAKKQGIMRSNMHQEEQATSASSTAGPCTAGGVMLGQGAA